MRVVLVLVLVLVWLVIDVSDGECCRGRCCCCCCCCCCEEAEEGLACALARKWAR